MLNLISAIPLGTVVLLSTAGVTLYLISWIIFTRYFHPLRHFPGPFLASVTDWWYFVSARYPIPDNTRYPLHERYNSKIVRIRPNGLSISDPRATDVVFGTKPKWEKTEFYDAFNPHIEGGREIFSLRGTFGPPGVRLSRSSYACHWPGTVRLSANTHVDEATHTAMKRTVGHLWTFNEMAHHEPKIDRLIAQFRQRLGAAADKKTRTAIDLPSLVNQYTLDVLGEVFWGKDGGFGGLKDDIDYKDWTALLTAMIPSLSVAGLAPRGGKTLYVFSQLLTDSKVRNSVSHHTTMIADAQAIVAQRVKEREAAEKDPSKNSGGDGRDMTSKLLDLVDSSAAAKDGKFVLRQADVTTFVYDAIIAGFDTTGLTITHIFYSLFMNPGAYRKLQVAIDEAFANGQLQANNIRYLDCTKVPYLNACINEAFRWSGAGNLGQVREVPKEGAVLADGTVLPPGVAVTINNECANFDTDVFGEDAKEFRPERWFEGDPDKVKAMERYLYIFGFGGRVCMGKHLASMEIWKMLPIVMKEYEFELTSKPRVNYMWFKRIDDFKVVVRRRAKSAPAA